MSAEDVMARLLNPGVVLTMIGAGIAYGMFLWALHIRPNLNLWLTAVVPGATFLAVIWSIRGLQGTFSLTYFALMVDWLIFAGSGVLTVLVWRWRRRPRRFP